MIPSRMRGVPDEDLQLFRVCASFNGYLALGNRSEVTCGATFVSNPDWPHIRDANHVSGVRATTPEAIDVLIRQADLHFASLDHQFFIVDPLAPPAFEARLVQRGFQPSAELELLLEGELAPSRAVEGLELRLAQSDADWATVAELSRKEEVEEARKFRRQPYSLEVTRGLVAGRRAKEPELRTWLARSEGVDCAHFSSWPGDNGIGKVEDLFTLPEFRRRGIASALISHCVSDARERGAESIMIGAFVDDTPRLMYEALGFRPYCVIRRYLLQSSTGPSPS